MKKTVVALRVLCGLLDAIIVMIPIQFIMIGIFQVSTAQADVLFKFLFAVYGALFTEYLGSTPGKYLGRLWCKDVNGGKAPILYTGLRELVKSMYVIPVIGWGAAAVSLLMMAVRKDGRTLHDMVGNTRVVYQKTWEDVRHDNK